MSWHKIKGLCDEKGITVSELCRQLGMSTASASDWKRKGATPRPSTLRKIADYFGVDVHYFDAPQESNIGSVSLDRRVVKINVYGTIPAGIPMMAIEDIIDTEEIPASWLSGGREYFALRVRGDSMYPNYLDGDTVIFRNDTTCKSGDDCIVYINNNDATLKRVKLYEDGSLGLHPINPNYPPCIFTAQQVMDLPITIGGVAVELRRKI